MKEAEINSALQNMRDAKGERHRPEFYDTIIAYGPGNWVWEFVQWGDTYAKTSEEAELAGNTSLAKDQYILASMWYKTAAFPGIFEDWAPNAKESIDAYAQSMRCYEKAIQYFKVPVEVVYVEVDGEQAKGYLHLPKISETQKVPAVLSTNGSDFFATELYQSSLRFENNGIACLVFDIPF